MLLMSAHYSHYWGHDILHKCKNALDKIIAALCGSIPPTFVELQPSHVSSTLLPLTPTM